MPNKGKNYEKANRITEIDDHIRRNFDILKVNMKKKNQIKYTTLTLLNKYKSVSYKIFCMTLIMFGFHHFAFRLFLSQWKVSFNPCDAVHWLNSNGIETKRNFHLNGFINPYSVKSVAFYLLLFSPWTQPWNGGNLFNCAKIEFYHSKTSAEYQFKCIGNSLTFNNIESTWSFSMESTNQNRTIDFLSTLEMRFLFCFVPNPNVINDFSYFATNHQWWWLSFQFLSYRKF